MTLPTQRTTLLLTAFCWTSNERVNLTARPVTRLAYLILTLDSHGSAQGARRLVPQVTRGVVCTLFPLDTSACAVHIYLHANHT